jgi:transcriptional regulator with XRE-family HTH domain
MKSAIAAFWLTAKGSLASALRIIRKARGLSQEAFSDVSSRTYMSSLERGLKSPTLNKLAELCEVMEIHPLTLLTLAHAGDSPHQADQLLAQVRQQLEAILKERDAPDSPASETRSAAGAKA